MAYREFCKSRYGRVINCPLLSDSASEAAARDRCRKLWTERYKEEPFDVTLIPWGSTEGANSAFPPETFPEPEIADIVAVISRQSSFYYQVSDRLGITHQLICTHIYRGPIDISFPILASPGFAALHVGGRFSASRVGKIQMLSAHCEQITRRYYVCTHIRH